MKKIFVIFIFVLHVISVKSQELFPDKRDSLRSMEIMKYIIKNEKKIAAVIKESFNEEFMLKQINVCHQIELTGFAIPKKFYNDLAIKHYPANTDSIALYKQIWFDYQKYRYSFFKIEDTLSLYKKYLNKIDIETNKLFRCNNPVDSSQRFFTIIFSSSYYEIKGVNIKMNGGRYLLPKGNGIYICFLFDDEDKIKDVVTSITVE